MVAEQSPIRMTVYLAASWNEAAVLRDISAALIAKGYDFSLAPSAWLDAEASGAEGFPSDRDECLDVTVDIVKSIRTCDVLIAWNGQPSTRGGMHVELGIAIGLAKPIIVVGEPVNLFQKGAAVVIVPDATVDGLATAFDYAAQITLKLRRAEDAE